MSLHLDRLRTLIILGAVIVTSLCLATPALGATVTINGVVYTTDDSLATASVTGGTSGLPTDVTIPNTITHGGNIYNVTTIDANAFFGATVLTSITIPNSVTSIGDGAFTIATGLTTVTFAASSNLTSIGDAAFSGASSLTSITIPNSVTTIGSYAFSAATSLQSITLPTNPSFISIGDSTFQEATSLQSITIPDSVTSIGTAAFMESGLRSITLPNNPLFTTIDTNVFRRTPNLVSITIPEGVTHIGDYSFRQDYVVPQDAGLESITIPNSLTSIGAHAFEEATRLTSITLPRGFVSFGNYAFFAATGLTRIELLGNQPSCGSDYDCYLAFSGVPGTVYRFANATGWPAISATTWEHPQAYLLLPPATVTAVAGEASATITMTAPSTERAPNTYTVTAVGDSSKTCTATAPGTSCTITGLTNGTSYTFTAKSNIPSLDATSIESDASNAVTLAGALKTTTLSNETGSLKTTVTTTPTTITATFIAPGPGTVRHVGTTSSTKRINRSTITVCASTKTITKAGKVSITCDLTNSAKRTRMNRALKVTITTTYTPPSGVAMVSTKAITLARIAPKAPVQASTAPSSVTG
jgi:hypothetical protein